MEKFVNGLLAQMNVELNKIALESENSFQKAEGSFYVVEAILQKLKDYVQSHDFRDQEEEIAFFKVIKPGFLKELIFFIEVYHIEADKPAGDTETLKTYYRKELKHVESFFKRNKTLYNYYRSGKTNDDQKFFLKSANSTILSPEYSLDIDPRFSTVHSFKLSKIIAFEQLSSYLQGSIYKLDHPELTQISGEEKKFRNVWTESKAALIELAYAMHARGAINNGKGDIKQIITDLEYVFNVQLGNFYRVYQGMRIRKKNRTAFLDNLKESLERRMDDADLDYQ